MENGTDNDFSYEEISRIVDDILGQNVSEEKKLQLFKYLVSRQEELSNFYSNPLDEYYYEDTNLPIPHNSYPSNYNQIPCINLFIPSNSRYMPYASPCYYQQQPILPAIPYSFGQPPRPIQVPMQMPQLYQQLPQFYPLQQVPYYGQQIGSFPHPTEKDKKSNSKNHKKSKKEHEKHKKDKKHHHKDKKSHKKEKIFPIIPIKPYCTCAITNHAYIRQRWYHCETCDLTGSEGMCEYCANHCHKGHDTYFEYVSSGCFCDCFDHDYCQLKPPEGPLQCTFDINHGKSVEQPMYTCRDCDFESGECICQNCALKLHSGHNLAIAEDSYGKICHHYKQSHPSQ